MLTGTDALDPDYTVSTARVQHRTIHFDDFLPLARTIIEQEPTVRAAIRQTYTRVFLDEFRKTAPAISTPSLRPCSPVATPA